MLTVVLSNFNHGRFLRQSLGAIFAQTRPADEVIVIDDASTDDSIAVIESCLVDRPQAQLIRNRRNAGVVRNMNYGIEIARGTIIHFAAADDITYPQLFERGMAVLERFPQAALFSSRSDLIDEAGGLLGPVPAPSPIRVPGYVDAANVAEKLMRDDSWFMGNTSLFRRKMLREIGGFPEELQGFTDGYVSRLLALKFGACYSPEVLGAWRRMPGGMAWSQARSVEAAERLINLVEKRMADASGTFPPGYFERWRGRHMFGVRRFNLIESRRLAINKGLLWKLWQILAEVVVTSWLFVTLRLCDLAAVAMRRWGSLKPSRFLD